VKNPLTRNQSEEKKGPTVEETPKKREIR